MHPDVPRLTLDAFLREASQFRLGDLPTEQPHPLTGRLSDLASADLPAALQVLASVDLEALSRVRPAVEAVERLRRDVEDTLQAGGRIYLCGCGATGRLSISLEVFWRTLAPSGLHDRVIAFMAGGDVALVRSIENFEDHPEYGARQLEELGFGEGDLLISCTEGGETPFVIGATERATELSRRPPWFLYCNPAPILAAVAERSRRVIENEGICKLSLFVGPMALSGSTRMQASTILMLAVGLALLPWPADGGPSRVHDRLEAFLGRVSSTDFTVLAPLVEREAHIYAGGGTVLYRSARYGITILTDTTERAPTFSLHPFENRAEGPVRPSLCFLEVPAVVDARAAWQAILLREPRPLAWPDLGGIAGEDRLLGFDFSPEGIHARRSRAGDGPEGHFEVERKDGSIHVRLDDLVADLPCDGLPFLEENLLLKMALNMHSTLVMGRRGRYRGNLMTWVRASNRKLIDRAIRYVRHLLVAEGLGERSYEEVATALFACLDDLAGDQPVVLRALERIRQGHPEVGRPGVNRCGESTAT